MKNKLLTLTVLFLITGGLTIAQGTWTIKANVGEIQRVGAVGFSIGNKGYVGVGALSSGFSDFWEYDPTTNAWTQKADFAGTPRWLAVGFSIGTKGYIGTGHDNDSTRSDFWEWDQLTNIWTEKARFPGTARYMSAGFSIGNKGYIGAGKGSSSSALFNDFWEWNQLTNSWIQKANFGGTPRYSSTGTSVGNMGYFISGFASSFTQDFWEWDPGSNTWTQKADFPGGTRCEAISFSIGNDLYYGTGQAGPTTGNCQSDFWRYNAITNIWTQKANFGGGIREFAVGFSIGSKGYIGTGFTNDGGPYYKDFWEYIPDTLNINGINEIDVKQPISISPNPFNSETTMNANCIFKNATLTIFSSNGKQVKEIKNIFGQTINLHRENLPSGIYFFQITQDNKVIATDKLIISDREKH